MPLIAETRPFPHTERVFADGAPGRLPRVRPAGWYGQVDCAVGPFPTRRAADRFAHRALDFGLFDVASRCIFALHGGWFVEVRPLGIPG